MLRIVLGMIIGAAAGSGLTYHLVAGDTRAPTAEAQPSFPVLEPLERATPLDRAPAIRADGPVAERDPRGPRPATTLETVLPGAPDRNDVPFGTLLDDVLAIRSQSERYRSLMTLAARAAREPARAFALARRIESSQDRVAYTSALVRELARLDPDYLVTNLDRLEGSEAQTAAIQALALDPMTSIAPERLLALVDSLDPRTSAYAQQVVLQRLAETDPLAAIGYAEALPPGQPREQALAGALGGLARSDPDAALAWLAAQGTVSQQVHVAVYSGVAESDPERAIDLLLGPGLLDAASPAQTQIAMPLLTNLGFSGGAERERVADRLLAARSPAGDRYLQGFLMSWSQNAPDDVLTWLGRNAGGLDAAAYGQIAISLSQSDPERAAGFSGQIPVAAREQWIVGVAQGYAQRDAEAAQRWLGQYAGQPVHRAAMLAVAQSVATYDAPRAAELLAGADLADRRATPAASTIALNWMRHDATAARAWITSLPRSPVRDGALTMLVATGNEAFPDRATLELFSSDQAREQALSNVILRVAQGDQGRARALLDEHITDPAIRGRTEQMIENALNIAPVPFGVIVRSERPTIR